MNDYLQQYRTIAVLFRFQFFIHISLSDTSLLPPPSKTQTHIQATTHSLSLLQHLCACSVMYLWMANALKQRIKERQTRMHDMDRVRSSSHKALENPDPNDPRAIAVSCF